MNRLSSDSFPPGDLAAGIDDAVPRINLADQHDCTFWSLVFGVTEIEIHHAASLVGPAADAVSHYLRSCDMSAALH